MFCPECCQQNTDDSKFCTSCGKPIVSVTLNRPLSPGIAPARSPSYVYADLKESGAVTAMSVVGFIFGLIGMMGSFIPCIGALAFYIGIPAALISAIALGIAYSQNAKKTFAVVAVTISLIGVVISGWQYFTIVSAGKKAKEELEKMARPIIESPLERNTKSELSLINIKKYFRENPKIGRFLIIEGEIKNTYPDVRQGIKIRGSLKTAENLVTVSREVYAGWTLAPEELENLSFEEMNQLALSQPERFSSNIRVLPGKTLPFMILFPPSPPGSTQITIEVISSQVSPTVK